MWCRCWHWLDCDGASWLAFRSVTGCRVLVLACGCVVPCWPVAAAAPVCGHVEEQPGSDGAAGLGPVADRGSLGRREGAGCVAVRCTRRRPAAGVELETLGGLERGHLGCRCPRLPRS